MKADETTIRLLVVSRALDDAEHVTSMMRSAGYTAKPIRAEDQEDIEDALNKGSLDIAMHSLEGAEAALDATLKAIRDRELFVPVIAFGKGELTAGDAMAAGAADRIQPGDDEQMRQVIIREFDRILARRRAYHLDDAYRETEHRARALMESSRDAIAYIHDGMHVLANDAYLSRFGYAAFEDIEGMPMIDLVAGQDQKKLKEFLRTFSASEEAVGTLQLALQQAHGNTFNAAVEFSRASIEGEACSQIIIRDRADTEELEKQLNLLSQRDNVTGLYNRQHFMQLLQEALDRAAAGQGKSGLFEIVLDDFNSVKERVGILGSDQVIADIAHALRNTAGEGDVLARLEGPAFAMLSPTADTDALDELAARVRAAVNDHICEVEDSSINVTATIGIAVIDGSTTDANDILSRAERAYAQAQERGRDAHRIYQPKKGELPQEQIDQQWVEKIRDILKDNRLRLLYRPIVSTAGDSTPRYEVLCRVLDDDGNEIDDPEMMAAADRTGMSKGLDRWTVLNALKALLEQLRLDDRSVFFVPLSGHAFDDPGLFKWIHDRLEQLRLPKGALVFQVDAAAAANRIKQASAFTTAAHKLGCGVSLSAFGHGADPFQVTRHVKVDYLRINEEFTEHLQQNTQNQEAIRRIASQAAEHGIRTLCPGVRDAHSLSVLWSLGTDMIEGDFLQEASTDRDYDFSAMAM